MPPRWGSTQYWRWYRSWPSEAARSVCDACSSFFRKNICLCQVGGGCEQVGGGAQPPAPRSHHLQHSLTLVSFSICRSSSGMLDADASAWEGKKGTGQRLQGIGSPLALLLAPLGTAFDPVAQMGK